MLRATHTKRPSSSLSSDLFLHCQKLNAVEIRLLFLYVDCLQVRCIVAIVVNVDQCASSSLVDYVPRM